MNDFLGRLAERSLARAPAVRPRLASPFEPMAAAEPPVRGPGVSDSGAPSSFHKMSDPAGTQVGPEPTSLSVGAEPMLATSVPAQTAATARAQRADGTALTADARAVPQHRPVLPQASEGHGRDADIPVRQQRPVSPPTSEVHEPPRPQAATPVRDDAPSASVPAGPAPTVRAQPAREVSPLAEAHDVPQVRPVSRRTGEPHSLPRPEAAAAMRDDSPPAGQPEPGAVSRTAGSRVIRPQVSLSGPATSAVNAGPQNAAAAGPLASTPPDVHITIGRVEIRAVTTPPPSRATSKPAPRLSLDDYLKQTAGGKR